MFDLPLFVTYLAAAAVLTITPGVDTAMVLRAATVNGARTAAMAAVGIGLGCLAWAAAVSFGLGVLLQASVLAYTLLKFAGAAYLVWLGVGLLLGPRANLVDDGDAPHIEGWVALRRGFLTNMLNPKVGVFYVTFLPQFIPAGASVGSYSFFLAAIHVAMGMVWFALLIAATAPLAHLLESPPVIRALDRLTGGLFVAFGIRLAVSAADR